jgi:alkanesulfonate monooxygenase SsuD/methylene tetrahydromethanopterin reductase-like flavin-dependent oxidoreductase (luciferase family)
MCTTAHEPRGEGTTMPRELRFGLVTPQLVPWPAMVERWQTAEQAGFDSVWVVDHFVNPTMPAGRWFEGWTMLAALATQTSRVRLGALVTSISFRNPALLAKEALTVDHISDGRLELGIGAGGQANDHTMTGSDPWPPSERVDRFAEFVTVVDALLRGEEPVSYEGAYYRVREAIMTPGPVQKPRPPITIGAGGPKMLKIAARFADTLNTSAGGFGRNTTRPDSDEAVANVRRRNELLDGYCTEIGRDPTTLRRSLLAGGGANPDDPWVSVEAFQDFVGRYHEAGIDEFLFYYPSRMELGHGAFEQITRDVMPRLRGA